MHGRLLIETPTQAIYFKVPILNCISCEVAMLWWLVLIFPVFRKKNTFSFQKGQYKFAVIISERDIKIDM